ncbi:hypothetical protein GCM10010921_13650 [Microbacterium album]|uniref:DUF4012 domain-containing protein n=1 Tax=Microbacterium album TaxID=2053191 RepID=A0A917IED9_9MICO|nr:hypothetical protein GCM10010921_13650 [Microbacterium album]
MIASVLAVALTLFLAMLAWVGFRAVAAQEHLSAAQRMAGDLRQTLASDPTRATAAVDALSAEVSAARGLVGDPVWNIAETLPWLGPQLSAAATITETLDTVLAGAARPLAGIAADGLTSLAPRDGRIDLDALASLRQPAEAAERVLISASQQVDRIDRAPLIRPLREGVEQVDAMLGEFTTTSAILANASELLTAMLGSEGPREYLLLFQNNAEWRALGGIPGAMLTLRTDGGAIELATQASSSDFPRLDTPILPLGDEITGIYGDHPGRWIQNVTQIPDFGVAAPLAREFWQRQHGDELAGVIAVDPVALSYLLEATGPIDLPTGDTLTAENAVSLLLNEVYLRYPDPREQDDFFATAAAAVFDRLLDAADPQKLIPALTRVGEERRLLVWSADGGEQEILDGTTLQGALPDSDADVNRFGVYLNDGTGSKLDYYMDVGAHATLCTVTPVAATAALRLELRNGAPDDAATSLPDYIVGTRGETTIGGTLRGVTRTIAYIYLPEGASLGTRAASTGEAMEVGTHDGRTVIGWWADTAPGETATLDLTANVPTAPRVEVLMTPHVRDAVSPAEPARCDSGR